MTVSLPGNLPVSTTTATPAANTAESDARGQKSSTATNSFGPAYTIDLSPEAKAAMAAGAGTPKVTSDSPAAPIDDNFGDKLVTQLRQEINGQLSRAMRGKT